MKLPILFLLLIIPVSLACIVPKEGMVIENSIELCSDVYHVSKGITIKGENIEVVCEGSVFKGWKGGVGVAVLDSVNVTVRGCRVNGFDIGFEVKNSSFVVLFDNHLVKNKFGVRFARVSQSATLNHDVSLSSSFVVSESVKNAFTLTNKFVNGEFCRVNYCNIHRDAVFLAAAPKLSHEQMQEWLKSKIEGKSKENLLSTILKGVI